MAASDVKLYEPEGHPSTNMEYLRCKTINLFVKSLFEEVDHFATFVTITKTDDEDHHAADWMESFVQHSLDTIGVSKNIRVEMPRSSSAQGDQYYEPIEARIRYLSENRGTVALLPPWVRRFLALGRRINRWNAINHIHQCFDRANYHGGLAGRAEGLGGTFEIRVPIGLIGHLNLVARGEAFHRAGKTWSCSTRLDPAGQEEIIESLELVIGNRRARTLREARASLTNPATPHAKRGKPRIAARREGLGPRVFALHGEDNSTFEIWEDTKNQRCLHFRVETSDPPPVPSPPFITPEETAEAKDSAVSTINFHQGTVLLDFLSARIPTRTPYHQRPDQLFVYENLLTDQVAIPTHPSL